MPYQYEPSERTRNGNMKKPTTMRTARPITRAAAPIIMRRAVFSLISDRSALESLNYRPHKLLKTEGAQAHVNRVSGTPDKHRDVPDATEVVGSVRRRVTNHLDRDIDLLDACGDVKVLVERVVVVSVVIC